MANSDNNKPTELQTVYMGNTNNNAVDNAFYGNYLYTSASYDRIYIYDISDPAAPEYAARFTDGTYIITPTVMEIVDTYMYVGVNTTNSNYMAIVDVSTPTSLSVAGHFGAGEGTYVQGATDIVSKGDYLYVCKDTYVTVYDISNRTSPVRVKALSGGTSPNFINLAKQMQIVGNYLYVTNRNSSRVNIIDITDPPNAYTLSSIATGISPWNMFTDGTTMWVGGYSTSQNPFIQIDVSDKENPSITGSWGADYKGTSSLYSYNNGMWVDVVNNLCYISWRDSTSDTIKIFNISDIENVTLVNTCGRTNPDRIRYNNGYLYTAGNSKTYSYNVIVYKYSGLITTTADIHALEMDTMDRVDSWSVSAGNYTIAPIYRSDQLHVIAVDSSTKQIMGYGEVTPIISEL